MSVTPQDIAIELGRTAFLDPSELEYVQLERWIVDARMLISARLGDLAELNQQHLDYVVRLAVAAHARRPDDATTVAISLDDATSSRTYRSSRGRVEIIDEWWSLLSPTDTDTRAFSIRPSGSTSSHVPWCSLILGAAYCSCGSDLTNYEYPLYEGGALSGDEY